MDKIPTTPTEVERVEQEMAKNPIELPESLRDPKKVFDKHIEGKKNGKESSVGNNQATTSQNQAPEEGD